jgi:hypothetical protein
MIVTRSNFLGTTIFQTSGKITKFQEIEYNLAKSAHIITVCFGGHGGLDASRQGEFFSDHPQ